jgi:hypothetical protein
LSNFQKFIVIEFVSLLYNAAYKKWTVAFKNNKVTLISISISAHKKLFCKKCKFSREIWYDIKRRELFRVGKLSLTKMACIMWARIKNTMPHGPFTIWWFW